MVAELAGLDEVGDEEDDGEHDAEPAHHQPQDPQEVVVAAHNGQLGEEDLLLARVLVGPEI